MSWFNNTHFINWTQASGVSFCAYLLGCFTSGYYFVRLRLHTDVREFGSGSVGAKNVGRILGKPGFFFTLLFDFGKGALAVGTTRYLTTNALFGISDDRFVALAMIAVVLGHIWPAQLRFRGGKGMATSLGALLAFDPQLMFAFAIVFTCLFVLLRRTVLPGLFALACVPFSGLWMGYDPAKIIFISILSALVLAAHRKNLIAEFICLTDRHPVQSKSDHT